MLMKNFVLGFYAILISASVLGQVETPQEELSEVFLSGTRLMIPFDEDSRSITIISKETIEASPAQSLPDLLQQVAGVDIRRRGAMGTQADLYIRGGSFDQTLLLIDGIKLDDAQTGHHTLNAALPLHLIERIEIIKGPAARIYGQNAFTGAINIVTKSRFESGVEVALSTGSYDQINAGATAYQSGDNASHMVHFSRNTSRGYRYNTDYDQSNYAFKSVFNKPGQQPWHLLGTFSERAFGANGFYASPAATDQYEHTQTSVLGISTAVNLGRVTLQPRVYWRRNQDEYIYLRNDPTVYRNLHMTNKMAAEVNGTLESGWGSTGFGLDMAQTYLSSNNLGQRSRFATTLFVEHRMRFFNQSLDVIPGVAVTNFSDFGSYAYPGIDLGWAPLDQWRIYANTGLTYRIPTYTDLFYSDPTTIGDADLSPEEAFSWEIGSRFNAGNVSWTGAWFQRDSKNLIDYVKPTPEDLWQAANVRGLLTQGWETDIDWSFAFLGKSQKLHLSYTHIKDDLDVATEELSKYVINSFKDRAVSTWNSDWDAQWSHTMVWKYGQRASGEVFRVFDLAINYRRPSFEFKASIENLLGEDYSETNLVPMPKGAIFVGMRYHLN